MKGQEPKSSAVRTQYIAEYLERGHAPMVEELSALRFRDICCYRTDRWYIGDDGTQTLRKYYSAIFDDTRCFVKVVENDSTIDNEIFVNRYMTERGIACVPQTVFASRPGADGKAILATTWLDDPKSFYLPPDLALFRRFVSEYLEILRIFRENQISHNDVSESNLVVVGGGRLMLTDFGIGSVPGSEYFGIDYVVHDGTYYRQNGEVRIYDDAWSFVKILDDAGITDEQKQTNEYRELLAQMGKRTHVVRIRR